MVDHVELAYSEVVRVLGEAKSGKRRLTRKEKRKLLDILAVIENNEAMLEGGE